MSEDRERFDEVVAHIRPGGELVELASGVDALYLSGRTNLGEGLLTRLADGRQAAEEAEGPEPLSFGGVEFEINPRSFGKYRYWLTHRLGQLGVSPSQRLPALRFQPRAEFLHGVGPARVVDWIRDLVGAECGPVLLTVSRIDLFADWQGWALNGDDRHRFVCMADSRTLYEDGQVFTGFAFGTRTSGSIIARIYDKTIESEKKGTDYWREIWGAVDEGQPVLRVEFEIARNALRQYGLNSPEEVLGAKGALWADLTNTWLSFRSASEDNTKSRWPVSPEWEQIRRARIAEAAFGIDRTYEGRQQGNLRLLAPGLVGYLSSFAALLGVESMSEAGDALARFVRWYESESGVSFESRVRDKRRNLARR